MNLISEENIIIDLEGIYKSIRQTSDKESKLYKLIEYYNYLSNGNLDDGGRTIIRSKILNIEKYLINWIKKHPNNSTIMQPEENAIILINDLRKRELLKWKI